MSKSSIEWTGHTWNPTKGCSIKSPGCKNCFAMREAYRFGFNPQLPVYHGLTKLVNGKPVWTGKLALAPDSTLLQPLKRKKPTTWFVNSMSDLFHEDIPDGWIDSVFAVMALTPQHTYQILTKRADRMREYFAAETRANSINGAIWSALGTPRGSKIKHGGNWRCALPLPNVWLGISCERQQEADERIPLLLQTPAAIRFISAEPLLGPIDLTALTLSGVSSKFDALKQGATYSSKPDGGRFYHISDQQTLDWVIVGGESGPDAWPMHPDWARSLRDQCEDAGVPLFFKQWGAFSPYLTGPGARANVAGGDGATLKMTRVGKKRAGRLLDGVEYNGMPGARR